MSLVGFLTAFSAKLLTLEGRSYYGDEIDPNIKLPNAYWHYVNTVDEEPAEDFIVEVDITGYSKKLTQLETIASAIDTGLNYWQYGTGGSPTFNCYRLSRLAIPTGEEGIARRQLRYRVRAYL